MIPAPAPDPLPDTVAAGIEALSAVAEVDGRWVLGLPRYDAPWARPDAPVPAAGWRQFRVDPRARGRAEFGAWAAIDWQDRIAAGAARQAGALALLAEPRLHDGLRAPEVADMKPEREAILSPLDQHAVGVADRDRPLEGAPLVELPGIHGHSRILR